MSTLYGLFDEDNTLLLTFDSLSDLEEVLDDVEATCGLPNGYYFGRELTEDEVHLHPMS